jgi:hypothetical protein
MNPWAPIAKSAVEFLPKDRKFTMLEALFSLQLDHNNGRDVTVSGMAKRWQWGRKKVRNFLKKIGVEISYPKPTGKLQNQRGQIRVQIRNRSGEKMERNMFIDFNEFNPTGNRSPQKKEQKRNRSGATTNEKEKENKKHTAFRKQNAANAVDVSYMTKKKKKLKGWKCETFMEFWDAFNFKKGKAEAADAWLEIESLGRSLASEIIAAARAEAKRRPGLIEKGRSPKWAQGWLSGRRWEDEDEATVQNRPQPHYRRPLE